MCVCCCNVYAGACQTEEDIRSSRVISSSSCEMWVQSIGFMFFLEKSKYSYILSHYSSADNNFLICNVFSKCIAT